MTPILYLYSTVVHLDLCAFSLECWPVQGFQHGNCYYYPAGLYVGPKLLPVTHVLVNTWTLIVKPVYKL